MGKMAQSVFIFLLLSAITFSSLVSLSEGLKKPVGAARREDIPYIKCQVCEKVASELYSQVQNKQAEISSKKISEYQIIEIAENVCNLKKQEADWILKIDIVEQGDKLELVDQDSEGQCNSECKTIERACQEVIGDFDTDVAEYIYKSKPQLDSLVNYLCKDLTRACSIPPPSVPKGRTPGEPFIPKPAKDAEMEKILKSMEGMPGAPGMKMYSREELMNMKNFGEGDEEDDDEEENFPSKLGKVLREKENEKADWKERIREQILNAGETLKRNANNVSNRLRRWWKGKKTASSKRKASNSNPEL
ncbi:hypothetical protein Nepgr_005222 [Nepenthes gracilis]|uniref:Saposin B-type domain-containing protein n=1 Tax=Nepenthes gracilis TaxID=150966 RepID=A0AAD3S2W2_NEPGR|nr:hypothetical protein Nepgr_005222 [Nepenthes gracilis]